LEPVVLVLLFRMLETKVALLFFLVLHQSAEEKAVTLV
jgi:hypothetical protein